MDLRDRRCVAVGCDCCEEAPGVRKGKGRSGRKRKGRGREHGGRRGTG